MFQNLTQKHEKTLWMLKQTTGLASPIAKRDIVQTCLIVSESKLFSRKQVFVMTA